MWRRALLAVAVLTVAITPLLAQETEGYGPPPMVWAVPHIQLHNGDGGTDVLRGIDASVALPLSPRTNVTATWFFDGHADDYGTATFNYDHRLRRDVLLRGSAGIIRDDFGFGVTVHRAYEQYGVGAFAQSVAGDLEAGVMLTREVPWGFKLAKVPLPRRSQSTNWNSGTGNVGDLGACAALQLRAGEHSELATTTAYFPQQRQAWPREGHSVQSASYTSTEFAPPAKPAWRYQTEGPVRSSAAIVDGVAYVGSYDGWLYALDVGLGRRLWRFPAESPITGAPSVCDDEIFFGTEAGDVFCVAQPRKNGPPTGQLVWRYNTSATVTASPAKPAWRYQTEGPVRSSAAIVDGVAYVGSYDGWLYALDVGLGRRLWRFPAESPITGAPSVCDDEIFFGTEAGDVFCVAQPRKNGPPTGQLVWRYNTSATVTASPLVTDSGLVIVGSCDSYIYALDRNTGKLVWKISTGGPVLASASKVGHRIPAGVDTSGKPTSRSASVLIGSSDGKLYAIEEVSGQIIWTFTSDGPLTAAPVLYGDRLYLTNRSGSIYALQPATGRQLWAQRIPGSIAHSPAVDDQRLYVGATEGGVFALDNATGKITWQCDLRTTLAAAPTLVNGQLMYLASRDGRLWTMDRPSGRVVNFHRESEPLTTCAAIADGHLLVGGDNGSVYAYVPSAGGLPLPPLDAADLPTPVKPVEAARPQPPAQPAQPARPAAPAPTAPAIPVQPTTTVPLPPTENVTPAAARPVPPPQAAPTAAVPVPAPAAAAPQAVAMKPAAPATQPPSAFATPKAPATTPAGGGRTDTPPADFPSAVVPQSSALTAPEPAVIKPSVPATKPPTAPTAAAPANPAGSKIPLLTLLSTPADGRTPVLLSNQAYLYVGGKVAPDSDIVSIRVNGLDTPIKDGMYQTQVTFPGTGDYLLLVETISRSGERSTYRRAITIAGGVDGQSPNRLALRLRGGSPIVMLSAATRGLQTARFKKTVEIRNADGQLVQNWVLAGDDNTEIAWNGANASGRPVAPGDYEVTYVLAGDNGPLAWLRQPLEVQE